MKKKSKKFYEVAHKKKFKAFSPDEAAFLFRKYMIFKIVSGGKTMVTVKEIKKGGKK